MSRFKYQMGMIRLRVRGMAKVTYTAMLRASGLNIHRAWQPVGRQLRKLESWRLVRPSKASSSLKETSELANSTWISNSTNLGNASTKRSINKPFCRRVNNCRYLHRHASSPLLVQWAGEAKLCPGANNSAPASQ
jgi:hypothetical protein